MTATSKPPVPPHTGGTGGSTLLDGMKGFVLGGLSAVASMVLVPAKLPYRAALPKSHHPAAAAADRIAVPVNTAGSLRETLSVGQMKAIVLPSLFTHIE